MGVHRFTPEHTALLVVDVQEKLLPHMHNAEALTGRVGLLVDGFRTLKLPVLVTEQYRQGLGVTIPAIAQKLPGDAVITEKLKFSACIEPIRQELVARDVRSVIVCGIEAHVCVLQTCLDLANQGYLTAVALDAIGSRRAFDQEAAVQRMLQAAITP